MCENGNLINCNHSDLVCCSESSEFEESLANSYRRIIKNYVSLQPKFRYKLLNKLPKKLYLKEQFDNNHEFYSATLPRYSGHDTANKRINGFQSIDIPRSKWNSLQSKVSHFSNIFRFHSNTGYYGEHRSSTELRRHVNDDKHKSKKNIDYLTTCKADGINRKIGSKLSTVECSKNQKTLSIPTVNVCTRKKLVKDMNKRDSAIILEGGNVFTSCRNNSTRPEVTKGDKKRHFSSSYKAGYYGTKFYRHIGNNTIHTEVCASQSMNISGTKEEYIHFSNPCQSRAYAKNCEAHELSPSSCKRQYININNREKYNCLSTSTSDLQWGPRNTVITTPHVSTSTQSLTKVNEFDSSISLADNEICSSPYKKIYKDCQVKNTKNIGTQHKTCWISAPADSLRINHQKIVNNQFTGIGTNTDDSLNYIDKVFENIEEKYKSNMLQSPRKLEKETPIVTNTVTKYKNVISEACECTKLPSTPGSSSDPGIKIKITAKNMRQLTPQIKVLDTADNSNNYQGSKRYRRKTAYVHQKSKDTQFSEDLPDSNQISPQLSQQAFQTDSFTNKQTKKKYCKKPVNAHSKCQRSHREIQNLLKKNLSLGILCVHQPLCLLINGCVNFNPNQSRSYIPQPIFNNKILSENNNDLETKLNHLKSDINEDNAKKQNERINIKSPNYSFQNDDTDFIKFRLKKHNTNFKTQLEIQDSLKLLKPQSKLNSAKLKNRRRLDTAECDDLCNCSDHKTLYCLQVSDNAFEAQIQTSNPYIYNNQTNLKVGSKLDLENHEAKDKHTGINNHTNLYEEVEDSIELMNCEIDNICQHKPKCFQVPKCLNQNWLGNSKAIPGCTHQPSCQLIPVCCINSRETISQKSVNDLIRTATESRYMKCKNRVLQVIKIQSKMFHSVIDKLNYTSA